MINIPNSFLFPNTNTFLPDTNNNCNAFSFYFPGCSNIFLNDKKNICPICLSSLSIRKARPSICKHIFCFNCIKIWSKEKKSCPLCRKSFLNIIII